MTPQAVLFDCDGVIVDSEPIAFAILSADLARHGLPTDHAQMNVLFLGGTVPDLFHKARALGATLPDDWVSDFYSRLYARLADGVPLVPGILTVLDRLDAAGIPYAIGSNGSDEKMRIMLGQHPGLIARFRGRAIKSTGDGYLATFDGPARAIRCALAMRDEIGRLGLALRAGLHTGEIELIGDDIGGIAVHTAARVAAHADANEVWASRVVRDLVGGSGLEFCERGEFELKGIPGTWPLFTVG